MPETTKTESMSREDLLALMLAQKEVELGKAQLTIAQLNLELLNRGANEIRTDLKDRYSLGAQDKLGPDGSIIRAPKPTKSVQRRNTVPKRPTQAPASAVVAEPAPAK